MRKETSLGQTSMFLGNGFVYLDLSLGETRELWQDLTSEEHDRNISLYYVVMLISYSRIVWIFRLCIK